MNHERWRRTLRERGQEQGSKQGRAADPGPGPAGGLVLAVVGPYDRRAVAAARYARSIAAGPVRALHVAADPAQARRLALDWMALGWGGDQLPLDVVEPGDGGVAATVAGVVRRHADGGVRPVTVVVAQMVFPGAGRRWLHDNTAEAIARAVAAVAGAAVLVVPVDAGPA